jgi:dTDP-4-dehydrorhamnose 3,5-epimerase
VEVRRLEIPEVLVFGPTKVEDGRGHLSESFRQDVFAMACGHAVSFVQENVLFSRRAGTVRGFHFQGPPHGQAKLVRVTRGAILDFALDLRVGSATYGRVAQADLTAADGAQIYLPVGFAHGFITCEPDTEVTVKLSNYYHAQSQGIVAWDDPIVAAPWPLGGRAPIVSERDAAGMPFDRLVSPFRLMA